MDTTLRRAVADDASAIAHLLVASRREFLPFAPLVHPPHAVRNWVAGVLLPGHCVHVAMADDMIVGVVAWSRGSPHAWIEQLYLLPGWPGRGIGSRLLQLAHDALPMPIRLYTFQENQGARRFYERHGYRAIAFSDGATNEERCPDVLYERAAPAR